MEDTVVTALNLATSAAALSQSKYLNSFLRSEPKALLYLNIATLLGNTYRCMRSRDGYPLKFSRRSFNSIRFQSDESLNRETRGFFDRPIPRFLAIITGFAVAGVALNRVFVPSKSVLPTIEGATNIYWSVPRSQDLMQFVTICNLAINTFMARCARDSTVRYQGAISSLANVATLASTASVRTICVETEKTFLPLPLRRVTVGYAIPVQGRENLQALNEFHSLKPFSEVAQGFVDAVKEAGGNDAELGIFKKVGLVSSLFGQKESYMLTIRGKYFSHLQFSGNELFGYSTYSGLFGTWKGAAKVILKGTRFFD
ncbi:MAG: hypothetical protein SNF33_07175 [Candidatus Algichlamydia australiensis]|nr:hypothetical protein [Chlamydiales bacterium]